MSDNLEIIQVSFPNVEHAKKLGKNLVEMKLVACCQIIPKITSIYSWENKLCEDDEVLMLIKSPNSKRKQIETYITENHEYDTPEFVVTSTTYVSEKYTKWAIQK